MKGLNKEWQRASSSLKRQLQHWVAPYYAQSNVCTLMKGFVIVRAIAGDVHQWRPSFTHIANNLSGDHNMETAVF